MTQFLWYPVNGLFQVVDAAYQKLKRLRPVGPLLYLEFATYEGPARELKGGVRLQPGQPLGILHINNVGLQRARRARQAGGFLFARLMLVTLTELAKAVEADPELGRLAAFRGITWIPPHGQRIGFEIAPLPDTWRNRLLAGYFRLLLFAFNPGSSRRVRKSLRPHEFWLSRESLLEHFSSGKGG